MPNVRHQLRLSILVVIYFVALVVQDWTIEALWVHHPALEADVGALSITFAQFLGCFILPVFCRLWSLQLGTLPPSGGLAGWWPYVGLTALVFAATGFANVAVAWVQYPVKVVFKSSKLIPTMFVALLLRNHKAFTLLEATSALFTVVGTCGFSWNAKREDSTGETGFLAAVGISCLLVSVSTDAFVSNIQQRIMRRAVDPDDPEVLMVRTNLCGTVVVGFTLLVTPSGPRLVNAVLASPLIPLYLTVIGSCLACGVWTLTTMIKEHGAVLAIYVATLRKVVTVVLSYLTFPKPMTALHLVSGACVLLGLVLGDVAQKERKQVPNSPKVKPQNSEEGHVLGKLEIESD
eukprot:TRINITY_DN23801_c3_g1_i1.p1 TRINITY_DN23801_c3_g1~~TRINITY_DN23801_c3_g1_i1.p1  ORF type:complete len:348 (+),score=13.55 TRINITY_DN23801_c3_g1_i1:45-1088(+)